MFGFVIFKEPQCPRVLERMLNHEFTTNANILKENHFNQHFKILVWKEVTLIEVSSEIITQHGVIFKSRINHCFAITFASNFYKNKGQPGFFIIPPGSGPQSVASLRSVLCSPDRFHSAPDGHWPCFLDVCLNV